MDDSRRLTRLGRFHETGVLLVVVMLFDALSLSFSPRELDTAGRCKRCTEEADGEGGVSAWLSCFR